MNKADTWQRALLRQAEAALPDQSRGVHLAVVTEPYLSLLLEGTKTVESRFTTTRRPPWDCVRTGDILLLKKSSGPVVGVAEVGRVWAYEIDGPEHLKQIRHEFNGRLLGQEAFWAGCIRARYATLLEVTRVDRIKHVNCHKRDQRGWVVLREGLRRQ